MKVYYDTEFLADSKTIELISIGMVRERPLRGNQEDQYYAVNQNAPWSRIKLDKWLMHNVVPSLPGKYSDGAWNLTYPHPDVKPYKKIADEVKAFLQATPDLQLCAWYGAYDHVALCQLWGRMKDLPEGIPMWTYDLRQEYERIGKPEPKPKQWIGNHNALADASHLRVMDRWIQSKQS